MKMPINNVRLLLVFAMAFFSFLCAAVAAPSITSVSPDPVTGSNNKQTFTVYGSGFVSGAQMKLVWPAVGVAPAGNATLVTTYITSSQLQVSATFGTDACTWTAQAINPGSVASPTYSFSVQAPAPVITSLSPSSASSGGVAFNLTVNGSTFAQNSVVRWNGVSLTTTATVNAGGLVTALTAQVPAANIASAGSATVTVYTPAPGGGTSSGAIFTVNSSGGSTVQLSGVPYIHQLYDTADGFTAGNDCCNAVAALMAIQYYGKLPANPITCTRNGTHISDYGFYISTSYSYNGHTFNIPSSAAWDTWDAGFYGGFGYFLQDNPGNSLQRSTRLSEYISDHGLTSSVDDAVSGETGFAKICSEIDAGHPVVVLTSITTSGHYITCIGYVSGQHTLIFNDSYGNKASVYPNIYGAGAKYDWPGYNYGYPNLNAVVRIIYACGINQTPFFGGCSVIGDKLKTTLTGLSAGKKVVLYVSSDLKDWSPIQTNVVTGSTLLITNTISPALSGQYFRASVQ
jgi:hypothetical protein